MSPEHVYDQRYFEGVSRESPPHTRERIYPSALRTAAFLCHRYHPNRVLDIGCAKGYLAEAFLDSGTPKVWGMDISRYAISQSGPTTWGRLLVADAKEGIPAATASFDLITALDIFEHLIDPALVLRDMHRVLTKQGWVYLKICHPRHPNAQRDPTHINIQAIAYWQRVFTACGFRFRRIFESELTPGCGWAYRVRSAIRRFREWAVIGTPADYKFLLWKTERCRQTGS